jgi:uncharacterized protein (DUF2164 family)
MIQENDVLFQRNLNVNETSKVNTQKPVSQNLQTHDTSNDTSTTQEDFFDNNAVQGRLLNRNDFLQTTRPNNVNTTEQGVQDNSSGFQFTSDSSAVQENPVNTDGLHEVHTQDFEYLTNTGTEEAEIEPLQQNTYNPAEAQALGTTSHHNEELNHTNEQYTDNTAEVQTLGLQQPQTEEEWHNLAVETFNELAGNSAVQHFYEQGIQPAPEQIEERKQQIWNDMNMLYDHINGIQVLDPEAFALLDQRLTEYAHQGGRYEVAQNGGDPAYQVHYATTWHEHMYNAVSWLRHLS